MIIDVNFQTLETGNCKLNIKSKYKILKSQNHRLIFQMKSFVFFSSIEILLNKANILNINLAKLTLTIFRLPIFSFAFQRLLCYWCFSTYLVKYSRF